MNQLDFAPTKFPFPVAPCPDESLVGLLIRATESNFLRSPVTILQAVTGADNRPPVRDEIGAFAVYCGCELDELARLFGFRCVAADGTPEWKIGGERLTRPYFTASRHLSFCPVCIAERHWLRAVWELAFYRVCAFHAIRLQDRCPVCHQLTSWRRSRIAECPCGADLRGAARESARGYGLIVAQVIEQRVATWRIPHISEEAPLHLLDRMTRMDLDDLFRTIWLCGWLLDANGPLAQNSKARRPPDLDAVVDAACACLADWPAAFYRRLEAFIGAGELADQKLAKLARRGPIFRYISGIQGPGTLFLRSTYESYLQWLQRRSGRRRARQVGEQLALRLEER